MSITERPVPAALKTMLVNNEPFQYAHLIKFERPSRPDALSGLVSTSKQRYTYLTDASVNVSFDDLSKDLNGTLNGTQVYLANKVLSVGAIQEQTKATTSTTTLVLDGNGLGAEITGTATIVSAGTDLWDLTYAAPVSLDDLLAEGFREGDKISVNGITVNINSFRGSNALRVSKIDTALSGFTGSVTIKLASEEIISILLNKNAVDYSSFINREVFIYRAYFKDGVVVGAPTPIFKGIISGVSFEDSESAIKVSWSLSSHWSDFAQVKGRVTSDAAHRALDANGSPQPNSALKPIYAYDKGFIHAETSINILTKYAVQVEKPDIKSKKGFLGIGASVKVKKYYVTEDRFTNLDFQIQAKSIPVIYGVRKIDAIPIFADTLKDNSAEVYIAAVLGEGEIGGIYDVLVDGLSLICNDKADFDSRAAQTSDNTVQVICRGRADRGDVLSGEQVPTGTLISFYAPGFEGVSITRGDINNAISDWYSQTYEIGLLPTTIPAQSNNYGLIDGDILRLTSPQIMDLTIFTGKSGQKASTEFSNIALAKNFKVQNAYWTGSNTYEYWGPNHRLLDTAYITGKFIISEGDTSIPEIGFVVRGKVIDCYNYDYSYIHDIKATTEAHTNFLLGDNVTLWRSDTNTQIGSTVQIIDKWIFYNPDGTQNVRFRYSVEPLLNYDVDGKPSITKFYMKNAANNTWTMLTHNYNRLGAEFSDSANRLNVGAPILALVTGVTAPGSGFVTFSYASKPTMTVEGDTLSTSPLFHVVYLNNGVYDSVTSSNTFPYAIMAGTVTNTSFISKYSTESYGAEALTLTTSYPGTLYLASTNTITLPASASAVNDFYAGELIEVTRYSSSTGKSLVQTSEIIAYDSATKIATIDSIWDFIPISTDTVRVYPKYADARVSINPAVQTLDYITSKTYGRGLNAYSDLYLPSWLETARKCDTKSDVTVVTSSGSTAIGAVYRYVNTAGKIIWQGQVSSISGLYVTFTNVLGKLTNKWNSWKTFNEAELVYNNDGILFRVTTAGVFATEPTSTAIPSGMSLVSTLSLTKFSGTGVALVLPLNKGNPVQALRNAQKVSGYSIYDCDEINYWKMSGWDEHSQRYATRNQSNITIDTALPLFDNTNGLLDHYNGILRYTAGKYYLDTEEVEGTILTTDVRTITVDDIIGKIQLTDEGTRSAFNSLTAAFADPANKFEARNVSFFNSEYLKADRNVPKKGNLSIPGITNYYNTRLLADGFLNKSRFGLTINMTLRPSGFLLLAGTVIQVIYPRYDWGSPGKKFRLESVNYQPDGLVDIVAKEYDDSFYTLSNIKRVDGTGATTATGTVVLPAGAGPSNLVATTNQYNQVTLTWTNDSNTGLGSTVTEIWRSNTNDLTSAQIIALVPLATGNNQFVDSITPIVGGASSINKYYWVRYRIDQ